MKAMILAAGEGTRLRPLTHAMPKPMIPVLGKPVIEYLIEQLARHGFDDIKVNTSYMPRAIEDYFADGRRWNVRIGYSFEGRIEDGKIVSEALGSAAGIRKIQDDSGFFDDTFVVVCGDILFDADLTRALDEHRRSGCAASLLVCEVPHERVCNYGVVVCDEHGSVSSFQEKPSTDEALSNLINTGIYIFEPRVIELVPPGKVFDIGGELLPAILQQGLPLHAIRMSFTWRDIGRPRDYWEVHQELLRDRAASGQMPGTEVRPQVWAGLNTAIDWNRTHIEGPVYIGNSTRIEAGCRIIGPTWIGRGCKLEQGALLERGVVLDHTCIHAGAALRDVVVTGHHCVDQNGDSPPPGSGTSSCCDAEEEDGRGT